MSQMGVSAISSFSHMELQQERETGSTGNNNINLFIYLFYFNQFPPPRGRHASHHAMK